MHITTKIPTAAATAKTASPGTTLRAPPLFDAAVVSASFGSYAAGCELSTVPFQQ